jgi:hypothetical protein
VELWKNILETKVRIFITQYERNRIGKSMVLLPELRGWPAGINTGRSKAPGETLTRSYAFLQTSSCSIKTPSSFQAHTLLPFLRRLLTHSHLILDSFALTWLLVQQQISAQGWRQKRLQAGSFVLLNVTHLPCPRGLEERDACIPVTPLPSIKQLPPLINLYRRTSQNKMFLKIERSLQCSQVKFLAMLYAILKPVLHGTFFLEENLWCQFWRL